MFSAEDADEQIDDPGRNRNEGRCRNQHTPANSRTSKTKLQTQRCLLAAAVAQSQS
jgi:hypothetical protein